MMIYEKSDIVLAPFPFIGTTLVATLRDGGAGMVANLGDRRAYLIESGAGVREGMDRRLRR